MHSREGTPASAVYSNAGNDQNYKDWFQNAAFPGSGCAKVNLEPNDGKSEYLMLLDFGAFDDVPADSCVRGVEVWIDRQADRATVVDESISLVISGSRVSCASGSQICNLAKDTPWPTEETTAQYGTCQALWGADWSVASLSASDFGIAIRVKSHANQGVSQASVCGARVRVHYTLPDCTATCP
jgi:hypothetical protein